MEKLEFIKRYIDEMVKLTKMEVVTASNIAETSFADWDGVYTPEEMVHEELTYWGD